MGYWVFKKQVLRWSRAVQDNQINRRINILSNEMGITTPVTTLFSEKVSSPMIIGFFRPFLLLPHDDYAEAELQFVLKHEFTHLKRHDLWYKLLLVVVNGLHWFNPLVYLMFREANIALELSCDDQVLKGTFFAERKAYGETILASIQRQCSRKTALSTYFYGGTKTMKERFQNIINMEKKRNGIFGFLLVLICIALIGGCTSPGNDDVETAYAKACEAFGWFHLTTMPLSEDMETKTYNGQTYLKVDHPSIHNMAELKAYLQTLFTTDIVNSLLDENSTAPRYRDFDNVLYAIPADRGTDITKGEATYEIVKENDRKIIYRVTVEILDFETQEVMGYETYDFPYEKIDDRWVFSSFELIY